MIGRMSSEVNPDVLGGTAAATAELGTELRRFGRHELRGSRELDPDAFGPLGRETGFTAALAAFSARAAGAAGTLSARTTALAAALSGEGS
jgi:hypothetical protein